MQHRTARRLLAGLGASIAAFGLATPPALAAPSDVSLDLFFPKLTVAADGSGRIANPTLGAVDRTTGKGPVVLRDLKISVDFAGVAAFAGVSQAPADPDAVIPDELTCSKSGTVLNCIADAPVAVTGPASWDYVSLLIKPSAAASTGKTGKLKFTAQATGVAPVSYESTVLIGEGVDLAAEGEIRASATPGGQAQVSPAVRNVGARVADGVVLVYVPASDLTLVPKYSNCRYGEYAVCTFPDKLEIGSTYRLTQPLAVSVPKDTAAPGSAHDYGLWMTPTDFADEEEQVPDVNRGKPGSGPALTLTKQSAKAKAAAAAPQTDAEPTNNGFDVEIAITGSNLVDIAAVGATITGAKGATAKTRLGMKNLGPAAMMGDDWNELYTVARVIVPKHVTVVGVDKRCVPLWEEDELLGAPEYACLPAEKLAPGASALFDFTFRLDAKISKGTGTVKVNDKELELVVDLDKNRRNDTAQILVNPTGPTGPTGPGAGGEGGGDPLPITGAATGAMAAAGALLLVAGGVGVLLARRRRVRFTA